MPSTLVMLAVLAAIVDSIATVSGAEPVRVLTKPLPALILALASASARSVPRPLPVGLLFAAIGDELLLRGGDGAFMAGMAAFAAMHVCYVIAFARIGSGRGAIERTRWLAVPYAAAAVALDAMLWKPAGRFAPPIAVYSLLLAAMAASALNAAGRLRRKGTAVLLAGGALLFMGSDTLLAFVKFWPGFPMASLSAEMLVVGTYFAAQIAITTGAIEATSSKTS